MALSSALLLLATAVVSVSAERETVNFDFAWRHALDKHDWSHPRAALGDGHARGLRALALANASSAPPPAAAPGFDDAAWEVVDTPHDMLITGPISYTLPADQGFRSRGAGWYRTWRCSLSVFCSRRCCMPLSP